MSADGRRLSELTTLRVGGECLELLSPTTRENLIAAALEVWASGEAWMLLAGGSNTVVADDGFSGTVIRVQTRGIQVLPQGADRVRLRAEAGESWAGLVAYTVQQGLAGIEALAGIPGSSGAAPVQNIGAYGQELSDSLVGIDFLDYQTGEITTLTAAELELGYRTSAIKAGRQGIVLAIELDLARNAGGTAPLSEPIAYGQLADTLQVELGTRVPIAELHSAVLALRAAKGMVLDPRDPNSVSAGSFFTNPIVSERFARTLPPEAPRWTLSHERPDLVLPLEGAAGLPTTAMPVTMPSMGPTGHGQVKLSAAWLIEHAGVHRGFRLPGSRAAISSKHTLAIINTGGASAAEIAELARYIRNLVQVEFGVLLQPEPVLVGLAL